MPDKKWRISARQGWRRRRATPNWNSAIRNSVRASAVHTLSVQLRDASVGLKQLQIGYFL